MIWAQIKAGLKLAAFGQWLVGAVRYGWQKLTVSADMKEAQKTDDPSALEDRASHLHD